ncbi:MAG: primosomal protein N' [candidate division Zixibacteria bacterium]|nr:primosomal protein N' [candidate division Zixibacteria bacterium]
MADKLINLAVVGPYQNLYTYKIKPPEALNLKPGCRFLIPFGKTLTIGFYVNEQTEPVKFKMRYAKERIDIFSPFPDYLFQFCKWISEYYYAGLGETLAAALPGTGRKKPKLDFIPANQGLLRELAGEGSKSGELAGYLLRYGAIKEEKVIYDAEAVSIISDWRESGIIKSRYRVKTVRKKILGYRLHENSSVESSPNEADLIQTLNPENIYTRQELLEKLGFSDYRIQKFFKVNILEKVFDESGVTDLSTYPIRYDLPGLTLLEGQQEALDELSDPIEKNEFCPFMLFGVTGSGKTLVYCHAARKAVEAGGSVLVMVPEIALSGLLLSSFAAFFGDTVAVIHSGLTASQRLIIRQKIISGDIKVVIGPRSAIFAPLKNPRLIIVDEEHDSSYKQDDPAPRYHGRDAAVMLAKMVSCPVILGSASPSVESYHNATSERYRMIILDQRPKSGYKMPSITTLDMKTEKIAGECSFLSFKLKRETEKHIADGGQIIYYLNRRGFSPRIKCRNCGEVPTCDDCGITFSYHRAENVIKCHFCDHVEAVPQRCPACNSSEFIFIGTGTQRVEENLTRLFKDVKAERIDSDKAASKSGKLILGDFAEEKFNLLLGTQMVTKGLDFPNVTLVGVLAADIGLDMPDFRAAEKTYSKLLQVAGRAGRGEREGHVFIQTYYSDHPVIENITSGTYQQFFDRVIEERRALFYPPFSRLLSIVLQSEDEKLLETEAIAFRFKLEEHLAGLDNFVLLGPAKAPLYKLRGQFRRRFLIKCARIQKVVGRFRNWERKKPGFGLPSKIRVIFDIDPVNMM